MFVPRWVVIICRRLKVKPNLVSEMNTFLVNIDHKDFLSKDKLGECLRTLICFFKELKKF